MSKEPSGLALYVLLTKSGRKILLRKAAPGSRAPFEIPSPTEWLPFPPDLLDFLLESGGCLSAVEEGSTLATEALEETLDKTRHVESQARLLFEEFKLAQAAFKE